jgi:hypothetical protein
MSILGRPRWATLLFSNDGSLYINESPSSGGGSSSSPELLESSKIVEEAAFMAVVNAATLPAPQ